MSHAGNAVKPKYGEKMIEVRIRFWTDDLANKDGYVVPKHGWAAGVVRMARNDSHGIVPGNPKPFNSLMEIPSTIEKVLVQHNIKLRRAGRLRDCTE